MREDIPPFPQYTFMAWCSVKSMLRKEVIDERRHSAYIEL